MVESYIAAFKTKVVVPTGNQENSIAYTISISCCVLRRQQTGATIVAAVSE